MKIEVGRSYRGELAWYEPEFDGCTWVFLIVAKLRRGKDDYFVGVIQGQATNISAQIFTADGKSPDPGKYSKGFSLVGLSRAKSYWDVAA